MSKREWELLLGGVVIGMIVCMFLLWASNLSPLSPSQVERRMQEQALSLGYATNTIIKFPNGEYGVQFNWITNSTK